MLMLISDHIDECWEPGDPCPNLEEDYELTDAERRELALLEEELRIMEIDD